jgi:TRAP-type C4-dicarboxylate transport system permease small subunit
MVIMVLTTALGVVDRFLLGLGLSWTEELSRFLLIWASLLSAVVATKRSEHFRVEVVASRLGPLYARAIAVFSLAVCLTAVWYGTQLAFFFRNQLSPALGIPMSFVYAAAPVGFLGMGVYIARDLIAPRRAPGGSSSVESEGGA